MTKAQAAAANAHANAELDRLATELARSAPHPLPHYQSSPDSLPACEPVELYLYALGVLRTAYYTRIFSLRGKTIKTYRWSRLEKFDFLVSELWVLASTKQQRLIEVGADWRAYLLTALLTNCYRYFNDQEHWVKDLKVNPETKQREPRHFIDRVGLGILSHEGCHEMDPKHYEELLTILDKLAYSAKRNAAYAQEFEADIKRARELCDLLDCDPDLIEQEARRRRRNYRDTQSRLRRSG